jgi:hypothetical protein
MMVPVVVGSHRNGSKDKARIEQRLLRSLGVTGEEIQIGEAPCSIRVTARQLRAFHEDQRPVVRFSDTREQRRDDEDRCPGRPFFSRELFGDRFSAEAKPARGEGSEAVRRSKVRLELRE